MVKRQIMLLFLIGIASLTGWAVTEEEVAQTLALFPEGQDVAVEYSEAGQATLQSAIEVLETALGITVLFDHTDEAAYMALEIDVDKKSWVNALSRGYYTLGDVFLKDDDAKQDAFVRGQYWGLKSLRISSAFATEEVQHGFIEAVSQDTDVAALFWTYGNWSRKDEFDIMGALFRDDPPKLEALIERAMELDPTYAVDAPYRALAAFWGGLPPLPLIKYGQNLPRALSYICPVINEPEFCASCETCPLRDDVDEYFENRLIFAEYYLMERELWDDAARVLQSILDDPIGDRYPLYNAFCAELAAGLLEQVSEHL
jgi:hypothetical protein